MRHVLLNETLFVQCWSFYVKYLVFNLVQFSIFLSDGSISEIFSVALMLILLSNSLLGLTRWQSCWRRALNIYLNFLPFQVNTQLEFGINRDKIFRGVQTYYLCYYLLFRCPKKDAPADHCGSRLLMQLYWDPLYNPMLTWGRFIDECTVHVLCFFQSSKLIIRGLKTRAKNLTFNGGR